LPEVEKTYARLRLGQLGPDYAPPGGDEARSTASLVVKLLELFDADPGAAAMSWRVFVLIGDLPSAELALTAGLGVGNGVGKPLGEASSREPAPAAHASPRKNHLRQGPGRKDSSRPRPPQRPPVVAPTWSPTQTRVPVPSLVVGAAAGRRREPAEVAAAGAPARPRRT
jgi:hypothetical protein